MPEETAQTTTSDETAQNTGAETEDTSGTRTGSTEDRTYTQADLDRLIAKTKREEKTRYERQIATAQLSEVERLKGENQSLKSTLRSREAERAVFDAVRGAGADDPEVVTAWIQAKLDLQYDDDGRITNLKEVISEARSRIPTRFPKRPGSANGGEGKSGAQSVNQSINDMIRRAAGRE